MRGQSLYRSRLFKVTDFGTNRKPVGDFLLVNNTNLRYLKISHSIKLTLLTVVPLSNEFVPMHKCL